VLAQIYDAVVAVDNDERITYLNAAAERQYQVGAAEVLGHPLEEIYQYRWMSQADEEGDASCRAPSPYAVMLGTPRAAIATRVATTEAIIAEITRALLNLKKVLDRLIVPFESSHPAFTAAYHAARKIVNAGNSHAQATPPA
jgi:PAS domain-containing protein